MSRILHERQIPLLGFFLILLSLIVPGFAGAGVYERVLPLTDAWDPSSASGRYLTEILGDPQADRAMAPSVTYWWMLADGERIQQVELTGRQEEPLASVARTARRLPVVSDEGNAARDASDAPLWGEDYTLQISPPRTLHGRTFQAIILTPLRAAEGRLFGLKAATLRLSTGAASAPAAISPQRPDFPLSRRILESLGKGLLNPESVPAPIERAVGGSGFPTEVPSVEGASVELVIVTADSFADLCQVYADFKTEYGTPAVVRTLDWIREHYPVGSDRAEMVRNFVRDAYAKWSIGYVLIVGDTEDLPPRYATSHLYPGPARTLPTDLYYGCLDGDWNADHDQNWGEAADSSEADPGDVVDLLPEVMVGRLPVTDRDECAAILDKCTTYQLAQNTPYQDRFLMMGEVLFPLDYPTDPNITQHGADYCEYVYDNFTGDDQHVVRLYESAYLFGDPEIHELTTTAAFDSMDNGFGIVLHNGHGYRQTMSVGNGSLDNGRIKQLQNGDNAFLLCMINCSAAAFDYDCLAEVFLADPLGGAVAVIGGTRETFPSMVYSYMNVFFESLFLNSQPSLGGSYYAAMNAHEPLTIEDTYYRWTHFSYTLLADPSMRIHYKAVGDMFSNAPASYPLDSGPLTITVTDGGAAPIPNAAVSIRKADEDYQRSLTDANGQVTFTLNPETQGGYTLRAIARDFAPLTGGFGVTAPGADPLLSIASIAVEDLTDGQAQGNGNGIAERGERVRLRLTVQNRGTVVASIVNATLRSSDPAVALLDSTDYYGTLLPNTQGSGSNPYLVQIGDAADDAILEFELRLTPLQGLQVDDFFLEAAAPDLSLWRTEIDDAGGGNGDGVLTTGETADIHVALVNDGRGTGQNVNATIVAPAGSGLLVLDGSDALGNLNPLSTNQGLADFTVRRVTGDPPSLDLFLTDALGRTDTLGLVLERPVAVPSAPTFEPLRRSSLIRLSWNPGADAAAYVILRAENEGGPFVEVSDHWVRDSAYESHTTLPWTYYWYKIQPLSAGGLLGTASATGKVRTNPALLPGWPVALGAATMSTPLIADVDGDLDFEIIVGADLLYGFNPDGTELGDGDNNPLTYGPVSSLGNSFADAITAADLTASPGMEVIACSWNALKVYVFEFTKTPNGTFASLAPGWPKSVPHFDGIWASPSVADIDGDGDKEIFVTEVGYAATLLAWHHNGVEVINGDNNPNTNGVFHTDMGYWPRSTAAFADVDGNGDMEIFVGTGEQHGKLKGFQGNGTQLPGFPFQAWDSNIYERAIYSSPAIGDVDGDGMPEIVFSAENDSLYVLDHNGHRHPGWPVYWRNDSWAWCSSPALADITGDGIPEIFATAVHTREYMKLAWFNANGQFMPGWPVISSTSTQSSPVVGDIDGDGDLEVVLGNEFAELRAWHHNGLPVDGFPIVVGDYIRGTPALMDVNKDGDLDLILTSWDMNVYIWTFPTQFDARSVPWYTFMHDQQRTGNFDNHDGIVAVVEAPPAGAIRLDPNWPNPFNPKTHIQLVVGEGAARLVNLSIHDAQGRLITVLVNERLEPGVYVRSWDGRDDSGTPQASGVYFARARVGDEVASRKLVLVK